MSKKIPTLAEVKAFLDRAKAYKEQFYPNDFYHASPSNKIKIFDPASARKGEELTTPGISFFSPNPSWADKNFLPYGDEGYKAGATMYPVKIKMGKHFDPTSPEAAKEVHNYATKRVAEDLTPEAIENLNKIAPGYADVVAKEMFDTHNRDMKSGAWDIVESPAFIQHLRDEGYDTFSVNELGQKGNIGVLEPHNIRGKFAKFNPDEAMNPDFMKAAGGSVGHYEGGGKVGALSSIIEPAVNRINMHFKDVTKRIPQLQESAQQLLSGTGSREAHEALVNSHKPVLPFDFIPKPATREEAVNALTVDKKDLYGIPSQTLQAGHPVGLRLDIPAYSNHGVWVPTIHEQASGFGAGKAIGHESVASVLNPAFGMSDKAALSIASGKPKGTIATIKGNWNPVDQEQAVASAQEYLNHPDWRQVGMDPERHGYFYDRATMEPITHAEEALQIGPLVLAKKPVYGNKEDFKFATGGEVIAKKALEFAKRVPFVHFSKAENLSRLEPAMYGTGIKGAEGVRLQDAPDIKPRSYFYTDRPDVRPEQGLGSHKYSGVSELSYPLHEDPAGYYKLAKELAKDPFFAKQGTEIIDRPKMLNEVERAIKNAGYTGYHTDDAGILFHPTEVNKVTD